MRQRHGIITFIAGMAFAVLLGLASQVSAQQCPQGWYCVGTPGVKNQAVMGEETATPTIAATPFVEQPCRNATLPEPAEGLQVWLSRYDYTTNVCARLFVNSRYIRGLPVEVYLHEPDGDWVIFSERFYSPETHSASAKIPYYLSGKSADIRVEYEGFVYRQSINIPLVVVPTSTTTPTDTPTPMPTDTPTP